ncbi:MAG TPA: flippase-like domain-containing protein, partial [Thermomicrobiales bacterium]|nr:flippase-like domain-containing protein [Thermomicrobiales bacterium]
MWLVARSLGAHLSLELTLFVALMSALLTTLPFTPAGLGLVEAAVVVVLKLVDVDADMAGSIAILDRLIGYWSLILVGMIMYIIRVRRDLKSSFRES